MLKRLLILVLVVTYVLVTDAPSAEPSSPLFPLGRSWAGDRELPRPFGIGLDLYHQTQDYELRNLRLDLPMIDLSQVSRVEIENATSEESFKADVWLLPFLNVFGIIGNVDGETTVNPGPPLSELRVDYDGVVYGGGATLAGGIGRFFGSVSYILTKTDLDTATSSVDAWILNPRIGVRANAAEIWVGAMYQEAEEHHRGRIAVPFFGDVAYDVELEQKEPWNYLVGAGTNIADHWRLELEAGFGNRKHALFVLGYRF
ncbi:MAG: hypothetical protein Q8Q12_21060 [bacterium]|nr:hypothetical protein [bacterium]